MNRGRVVIAGGSLGGLTAGLLLRDLGLDVTIHERSPAELEQRGAGIGFLPDSYRYLVERAGIVLDEISVATGRIRYLGRGGDVVHDQAHEYRFSSWNTVYRRLLGCFDRRRYFLGCEVTGFAENGDGVRVEFAHDVSVDADLLVCADGVGSPARRRLLPDVRPSYSGYVAWRGMVPEVDVDDRTRDVFGDAITYFVFANSHILLYPIPGADGSVRPGERLINFVWYRNYLEGDDLDELMTDTAGTRHDVSVPPGAVRDEHVAEMRAVARARLPDGDRRTSSRPSSGRSCKWCTTWRCRGWRSDGSASSATRPGSCGPMPPPARRRPPPTGGRWPTPWLRPTTSRKPSARGSRASSSSAANCSTGRAASGSARRSTAPGPLATRS